MTCAIEKWGIYSAEILFLELIVILVALYIRAANSSAGRRKLLSHASDLFIFILR